MDGAPEKWPPQLSRTEEDVFRRKYSRLDGFLIFGRYACTTIEYNRRLSTGHGSSSAFQSREQPHAHRQLFTGPCFNLPVCSSEGRRVGKECLSPCNLRWSMYT